MPKAERKNQDSFCLLVTPLWTRCPRGAEMKESLNSQRGECGLQLPVHSGVEKGVSCFLIQPWQPVPGYLPQWQKADTHAHQDGC